MNRKIYMNLLGAFIDKDSIYAVDDQTKFLFEINKDTFEVECIGKVDILPELKNKKKLFNILKERNILYFIFKDSYDIIAYDLKKCQTKFFVYDKDYNPLLELVCKVNNEIWMFGYDDVTKVCIFSLDDFSYRILKLDILNDFHDNQIMTWSNKIIIGTKIWRCVAGTNVIYSIDTLDYNVCIFIIEKNVSLFSMSYYNHDFYLTTMKGREILRWNEHQGLIAEWEIKYSGELRRPYRQVVFIDETKFLLLPSIVNTELLYCLLDGNKIEKIVPLRYPFDFFRAHEGRAFMQYYVEQGYLCILPCDSAEGMLKLNLCTLEMSYQDIVVKSSEYIKFLACDNGSLLVNEKDILLEEFLHFIMD